MSVVQSVITDVVVYADRALVTRRTTMSLAGGVTSLEFADLPACTDQSSVRICATEGVTLRDVAVRRVFTETVPSEERARLAAELDALRDEGQEIDDREGRARGEREFVERIAQRLTGDQGKPALPEFSPDNWARMVDFYRERLSALDSALRDAVITRRAWEARIQAAQARLDAVGGEGVRETVAISVVVETGGSIDAEILLSYSVYGPSWSPIYDLRATPETKRISVSYNALITQNTGEEWRDTRMRLSTAPVHVSGQPPEVEPWYIGIRKPMPLATRNVSMAAPEMDGFGMAAEAAMADEDFVSAKKMASATVEDAGIIGAGAGGASVEFAIVGTVNIPGDGEPHRVGVTVAELPGTFSYFAAPAFEEHAYLTAEAINDRDYPLLPGPTRVYLDGAFVAEATLDLVLPGEKFETSLGVDQGMSVEYRTVRTLDSKSGMIGRRVRALTDRRIILKNRRKTAETIVVKDRVPVSTHQDIQVRIEEPDYRKDGDTLKKDETDVFTWTLRLEPSTEFVIPIRFSVEYPAGASLTGF